MIYKLGPIHKNRRKYLHSRQCI